MTAILRRVVTPLLPLLVGAAALVAGAAVAAIQTRMRQRDGQPH